MFEQLSKEIAEAGFEYVSLEALQAIKDDKIKLSHTAHTQFNEFMEQGAKMFS